MYHRAVALLLHVQYINVDLYVTSEYPSLAQVDRIRKLYKFGTWDSRNYEL